MKKLLFCLLATFVTACSGGGHFQFLDEPVDGPISPSVGTTPSVNQELAAKAGLERIVFRIGPVDLPAGTRVDAMLDRPLVMRFHLSAPAWIVGFEPRVIDVQGARLPGDLLHEALLINAHDEDPLCGAGSSGNPIAAATSLLTDIHFPDGYGYPILPTDPLEARVVLKNQTDKSYPDVSFEIALLTKPMNELMDFKEIVPVLLEFDPCDHEPIDIPPGEFKPRTQTFTMARGGNIVLANGLAGDFAATISLAKDQDAAPFWQAAARLDEDHRLLGLDPNPFEDPAGVSIAAGGNLLLSLTYDNTSTDWLAGAPAGAMVYLAEEE